MYHYPQWRSPQLHAIASGGALCTISFAQEAHHRIKVGHGVPSAKPVHGAQFPLPSRANSKGNQRIPLLPSLNLAVTMPKKLRELKQMLRKAGCTCQSGKGSHTKWSHPSLKDKLILSGNDNKDAKPYQERDVENYLKAIEEAQS